MGERDLAPAGQPARFEAKVMTPQDCAQALAAGAFPRPWVFTNGVFDLLHRGHVTYLDRAAQLGATLIVAVNTDASARRLGKGPERPLNACEDRAALLASLGCTDLVTWFDEDTPEQLIDLLRPDVIVKGGDYDMAVLPETALVESWGGRAVAIPFEFQRSTTALVGKIRG
ncbi:ADP-heptose synthase / D-glycero-beta-D-manno-heptose 7-phosphate kinase [plant metagenome]|uniref:ADP-heptose synthase / D-glycero-beta-D-manno-heptose 7-phosphate kinase n=2 Tax=root TaxID=1 RepID=A0A1C3K569_9BURK|nr:adenylyltransferase/cytidyltransferase family protein [Orrella dioscoreae]SBT26594.1 ADP-heptose synthase / D-glycero-beta-D-manno-heptose 7-phosphate kinase [Orrella dioscoreae]SOE46972.1 ADP-heptose synthase / D-glycero-beta-D-manno-heptose 7-phosphate kinase [Orrella dioscoreae]